MGQSIGGDWREITVNHPRLGFRSFRVKGGQASVIDKGGSETNDDAQGVDSSGEPIWEMTFKRWRWEGTIANDMNDRKDLEFLQEMSNDIQAGDLTFEHMNGIVYGASGKPVGQLRADAKAATISVIFAGGGELTQV